jgi:hypothetical protein
VSSEGDELEYDLSAFEVPDPPDGIADAVIARLDGTAVTPAVPTELRDGKRRGYLVAGVAVAVLAATAGTYALIQGSRRAGPMRGEVVAVRARTLALDGVTAELDAGAQVKWQRHGRLLDVEQREGAAAWRVAGEMTLRIDAGAMVASVEATGASLRVEVSMNATDARVLGASALTAAVVSMVTVTVYTGHVKISERGQTVIVQPGETHTVVPPQPAPPEPVVAGIPAFDRGRLTIADVRIPAGESSTIDVSTVPAMVEVDAAGRCTGGVEYYRDGAKLSGAILTLDAGTHGYAVRCTGSATNVAVGTLTVVAGAGHTPLAGSGKDPDRAPDASGPLAFLAQPAQGASWPDPLPVAGQVVPGATVSIGTLDIPVAADGRFAANVARPVTLTVAVRVEHAQRGIHYVVVRGSPATASAANACDEVSCVLSNYQGACCAKFRRPVSTVAESGGTRLSRDDISKTIAAAKSTISMCGARSKSAGKVIVTVKVRPDGTVTSVSTKQSFAPKVSSCVADVLEKVIFPVTDEGGTFTYPFVFDAPACDADALKDAGMTDINMGRHAAALAKFEASLSCKADPYVVQLAFMSACSSKNQAKARQYYVLLSPAQQTKFGQICLRNNIDATQPVAPAGKGYLQVLSKPAGKVLVDGVDTGLTTPVTGTALEVDAGAHKVTIIVGDDRFTWPVAIKSGETGTLDKNLE